MNERVIKSNSKILIVVPERLGDALMTTPSVRYIKEQQPDTFLTVVTVSKAAESIYRHNPWIDAHVFMPATSRRRELRKQHNFLLHPHPDFDEQLVSGYGLPVYRPPDSIDCHHAYFELKYTASLLGLSNPEAVGYVFEASADEREKFSKWREQLVGESDVKLIAIAPGCNRLAARGWRFWKPLSHKKAWPSEKVIELIAHSHADAKPWQFVLLGAGGETKLAASICKKVPYALDMTGKTTGSEISALIDQMDAVVTMDSGLQHVTCACRRPLIVLCGPTNPERTGPWPPMDNFRVIHRDPMSEISVQMVYDALSEILEDSI